jgi:DNA-binding MarR family transcriptional regulator
MQKSLQKRGPNANDRRGPPYISAFLRLTYQATRRRLFKALTDRGFTDLNPALLNVFVYPPPDGVRPTELADRLNMSKQALNYLLGQLEALGYVERRSGTGAQRLVFLTRRGWQVFETQWEALRTMEDEWSAILGARKFDDLKNTLRRLSSDGGTEPIGRPPP